MAMKRFISVSMLALSFLGEGEPGENLPAVPHGSLPETAPPRRPSPVSRRLRGAAGRLEGSPRRRQQPAEVRVVVLLGAEQRQQRGAVVAQRLTQQLPVHPAAAAASPGTGPGAGTSPAPPDAIKRGNAQAPGGGGGAGGGSGTSAPQRPLGRRRTALPGSGGALPRPLFKNCRQNGKK